MFKFKANKSPDVSQEKFLQAIACARTSIESILYEKRAVVDSTGDTIEVSVANMTLQQCKAEISGSFCDDSGTPYAEFQSIEAFQD